MIVEGTKDELEAFRQGVTESGLGHFIEKEMVGWSEAKNEFRGFEIVI